MTRPFSCFSGWIAGGCFLLFPLMAHALPPVFPQERLVWVDSAFEIVHQVSTSEGIKLEGAAMLPEKIQHDEVYREDIRKKKRNDMEDAMTGRSGRRSSEETKATSTAEAPQGEAKLVMVVGSNWSDTGRDEVYESKLKGTVTLLSGGEGSDKYIKALAMFFGIKDKELPSKFADSVPLTAYVLRGDPREPEKAEVKLLLVHAPPDDSRERVEIYVRYNVTEKTLLMDEKDQDCRPYLIRLLGKTE